MIVCADGPGIVATCERQPLAIRSPGGKTFRFWSFRNLFAGSILDIEKPYISRDDRGVMFAIWRNGYFGFRPIEFPDSREYGGTKVGSLRASRCAYPIND